MGDGNVVMRVEEIIGRYREYGRDVTVEVQIELRQGRKPEDGLELSICGTETEGIRFRSGGQIFPEAGVRLLEHCDNETGTLMHGWTRDRVEMLNTIHRDWHLNHMRAGCVHQRSAKWGTEDLEVTTYKLTTEGHRLRRLAVEEAARAARAGEVAQLDDTGRALLTDAWFLPRFTLPAEGDPLFGLFNVDKRETKSAGWVRENEHPRGQLCKPCPTCGYRYGSSWLKEPLPEWVISWVREVIALKERSH